MPSLPIDILYMPTQMRLQVFLLAPNVVDWYYVSPMVCIVAWMLALALFTISTPRFYGPDSRTIFLGALRVLPKLVALAIIWGPTGPSATILWHHLAGPSIAFAALQALNGLLSSVSTYILMSGLDLSLQLAVLRSLAWHGHAEVWTSDNLAVTVAATFGAPLGVTLMGALLRNLMRCQVNDASTRKAPSSRLNSDAELVTGMSSEAAGNDSKDKQGYSMTLGPSAAHDASGLRRRKGAKDAMCQSSEAGSPSPAFSPRPSAPPTASAPASCPLLPTSTSPSATAPKESRANVMALVANSAEARVIAADARAALAAYAALTAERAAAVDGQTQASPHSARDAWGALYSGVGVRDSLSVARALMAEPIPEWTPRFQRRRISIKVRS